MWWPELDCIFQVGLAKWLVEWKHELCALLVEVAGNEILQQVFSFFFWHLRSLVSVIPMSRYSSRAISCWFDIVWLFCLLLWPMCITAYLSTFKFICHLFAQSTSLLRSSCKSRTTSRYLQLCKFCVIRKFWYFADYAVVWSLAMRKCSGPRTLSYGTPDLTGIQLL